MVKSMLNGVCFVRGVVVLDHGDAVGEQEA